MRKRYDFNSARKNPYARRLERQVTIRIDETTLDYFKQLASELAVTYQTLIEHGSPRLRHATPAVAPGMVSPVSAEC